MIIVEHQKYKTKKPFVRKLDTEKVKFNLNSATPDSTT